MSGVNRPLIALLLFPVGTYAMLIAEFTLSSPVLRDALGAAPGTTVEVDRVEHEHPTRVAMLARGQDLNRFEEALALDDSVEKVAVRGRGPAFGEYEVTLTSAVEERTTNGWWKGQQVEPLSVVGSNQGWDLRMRFPSRDALAAYRDVCRDRDIAFTLHSIYGREDVAEADALGLAREQPGGTDETPAGSATTVDEPTVDAGADGDAAPTGPDANARRDDIADEATDDD